MEKGKKIPSMCKVKENEAQLTVKLWLSSMWSNKRQRTKNNTSRYSDFCSASVGSYLRMKWAFVFIFFSTVQSYLQRRQEIVKKPFVYGNVDVGQEREKWANVMQW